MEKEKLVNLVIATQNGDNDSINTLFNEFYNDVYYLALRETKNQFTAYDITQDTFIEIINTISNLKEPAAFVSWMKTIAYHQCTRYYKKKEVKHELIIDEQDDMPTIFDNLEEDNADFIPDKALDNEDFKETITNFICDLPDTQRSAIMMKYFDELSVKEIAEIQEVSENTVLSRLNYGRKAIRTSIEAYEVKNNIKLHSVAFMPLLKWLFGNIYKEMNIDNAVTIAKTISDATGAAIVVSGLSASVATTAANTAAITSGATSAISTAATVGSAVAKKSIVTKIAALPIAAKITSCVIAAAILITTPLLIKSGVENSKIDAFEYLNVTFEGVNSFGYFEVDLDKRGLLSNIIGEEPEINDVEYNRQELSDNINYQLEYDEYKNDFDVTYDQSSKNLSNGDVISITIDVTGKSSEYICGGTKEFVVFGLDDVEIIEVFDYVDVSFKGINGDGRLEYELNSENAFVNSCNFFIDKQYYLSNGDEVELTIDFDIENVKTYGYAPKNTTKKFIVNGLPSYVTNVSQIPVNVINSFASKFLEEKSSMEPDSTFSYSDFQHYKSWFLYENDSHYIVRESVNSIVICVSYKEYLRGEYWQTVYTFLDFHDVMLDANGNLEITYEDGKNNSFATDIKVCINDWEEKYNVTEIK